MSRSSSTKRQQLDLSGPALLVTYDQLGALGVPYSRVHLRRLVARRDFPNPIRLSPGRVAWKKADIVAWLEAQPAAWTEPVA
jgi:predicted DNA-binding transcriptional regulator AlpA